MEVKDFDIIKNALNESNKYGLTVEVVAWALQSMKADPTLSVGEAMALGLWEWIK